MNKPNPNQLYLRAKSRTAATDSHEYRFHIKFIEHVIGYLLDYGGYENEIDELVDLVYEIEDGWKYPHPLTPAQRFRTLTRP
jgi:DNA-dependent RNA polymerase auxiliary subunit epsilon